MISRVLALASLMLAAACDPACPSDTRCIQNQCVAIGQLGDPCLESGSCGDGLWCPPPSFHCAPRQTVGPSCDREAPDPCGDGWCDVETYRCRALPIAGDDCTLDGTCAPGAFCTSRGVCVGLPREGERCKYGNGCALGLLCEGAICVQPAPVQCGGGFIQVE